MKQSLGRGLDALIPKTSPVSVLNGSLLEINLTDIIPNDNQPRRVFDPILISELADSIKMKGVIQPIIVTKSDSGKFMIIEGERRWRASGLAGKKSIPAVVKAIASPKERLELALITNAQREDLNPVELALAYKKLMDEHQYKQEDLAVIAGKSRSAVANRLRLLGLPKEVMAAIEDKTVTEGHARALLGLSNHGDMIKLGKQIIEKDMTVRDAERAVKKMLAGNPKQAEPKKPEPHITALVAEMEDFFQSKVNIKEKAEGGVIEIKYNSDDELDSIIDKIRGY